MEEYTDEQVAQDIFATMDSVGIVERIRQINQSDRTEDDVDSLSRNERHIQIKMAKEKFVNGLSEAEAERIEALNLPDLN
tara:strand:+ start:157 stop:396 length:240 start_codon:yes stop_codon:yes gene_type:complete